MWLLILVKDIFGMLSYLGFAIANLSDLAGPFILAHETKRMRSLRPDAPIFKGFSGDYIVLTIFSNAVRLLYILCYVFPSSEIEKQYARRYFSHPVIDKLGILQLLPYVLCNLGGAILLLMQSPQASLSKLKSKLSIIAKVSISFTILMWCVVYYLSSHVKVESSTGMGFWGLYLIDSIDLLKGIADVFDLARLFPQLITNWEECSTVSWSIRYVYLLCASSFSRLFAIIAGLLSGNVNVIRPPGLLLYALLMTLLSTLFLFQHHVIYRKDNERIWLGIYKRIGDEDDESNSNELNEFIRRRLNALDINTTNNDNNRSTRTDVISVSV
ncbi:hypothetical protein V1511DRAFT_512214 [Dipodascopsis uninucleata]